MSEVVDDVNSKTSLAKRLWTLIKGDAAKGAAAYTSVLNWAFMALAVWQFVGPIFAHQGAVEASAQVASLSNQIDDLKLANDKLAADVAHNKRAYEAALQDSAELSKQLDIARTDPKPEPAKAVAAEPPVNKVRPKRVAVVKTADPTTWEQFVSWYEKNVGTPGAQ